MEVQQPVRLQQVFTRQHADGFGNVWRHNGVAIPLDDVHKQFAVDFANVMLANFMRDVIGPQMVAMQKKIESLQPKEQKLIVEG